MIIENLLKLVPGRKREPKLLVVFSNRRQDCDCLIRFAVHQNAASRMLQYPIQVYCLKQPFETLHCTRVVVNPDPVAPGLFSANGDGKRVAAGMAVRIGADGSQTSQPLFQCGPIAGTCTASPIDLAPPPTRSR